MNGLILNLCFSGLQKTGYGQCSFLLVLMLEVYLYIYIHTVCKFTYINISKYIYILLNLTPFQQRHAARPLPHRYNFIAVAGPGKFMTVPFSHPSVQKHITSSLANIINHAKNRRCLPISLGYGQLNQNKPKPRIKT